MIIPAAVAAALDATLDSTCVITRPGTAAADGLGIVETGATTVYDGPCSLLTATGGRTGTGGDDRTLAQPVLRLPLSADGLLQPGDRVVVDDVVQLVVADAPARTHQASVRVTCAGTTDAPGVPR